MPPALIFMNEDKYFSHLARSLFELQISYASIFYSFVLIMRKNFSRF